MIYIKNNIIYVPRTTNIVGKSIIFTNLVTKCTTDASVLVDEYYYKVNKADLDLEEGQYSYSIDDIEEGLAQFGDFTNEKKSYNTKINYKQYSR